MTQLRLQDEQSGHGTRQLYFISDEHAAELDNVALLTGDLLLNITGDGKTFGRACLVPNEILPARVNQHVAIVRIRPDICLPGYLLSYLTHPRINKYIESFNSGGSRRAITKGHIESFIVPIPPLRGEPGYVLEVFNARGESIAVVAVHESDIDRLRVDEVLAIRCLGSQ